MPVDPELVRTAQAGDPRAFESLAKAVRDPLLDFCRRFCVNGADAEDAVQETLLLAQTRIGQFEWRSSFETWLHRIAMNELKDLQKKRGLVLGVEDLAGLSSSVRSAEQSARLPLMLADVKSTLEERDRLIFVATYQWEMDSDETSRLLPPSMALTASGVRTRLKRTIRPVVDKIAKGYGYR